MFRRRVCVVTCICILCVIVAFSAVQRKPVLTTPDTAPQLYEHSHPTQHANRSRDPYRTGLKINTAPKAPASLEIQSGDLTKLEANKSRNHTDANSLTLTACTSALTATSPSGPNNFSSQPIPPMSNPSFRIPQFFAAPCPTQAQPKHENPTTLRPIPSPVLSPALQAFASPSTSISTSSNRSFTSPSPSIHEALTPFLKKARLKCHNPKRRMLKVPRVALLLRGASFRYGNSSSTADYSKVLHLSSSTTKYQERNTLSHKKMIVEPFEQRGHVVDVFSISYRTGHEDLLRKWYGARLKCLVSMERSTSSDSQWKNLEKGLTTLSDYIDKEQTWYRFVVIIRHDMLLHTNIANLIIQKRKMADYQIAIPYDGTCNWRLKFKKWVYRKCLGQCVPDHLQVVPGHLLACFLSFMRWSHQKNDGGFIRERLGLEWAEWAHLTGAPPSMFLVQTDECTPFPPSMFLVQTEI